MNTFDPRNLAQIATLVVLAGCQAASPASTTRAVSPAAALEPAEAPANKPSLVSVGSGAMVAAGAGNVKVAYELPRRAADDARCGGAPAGSAPASWEADRAQAAGCLAITNGTIVDTPLAETF